MTTEAPVADPKATPPAPAPAPAPAATPDPAAPPAKAEAPAPAAADKSLLGGADAPLKPGEAKPGEVKVVPEVYKDFTLPDGLALDAKLLDGFKGLAKEAGLSQEAAQKFVTLQSEHAKASMEAMVKQAETEKVKMLDEFKQQTIKELGPDYQKELSFAAKALNRFGTPELRKLMDDTGLGNHPLLVKAWVAIGKTMAEDTPPGPAGQQPVDSIQAQHRQMFPLMFNEDGTPKK
jgi:hypothetical protein